MHTAGDRQELCSWDIILKGTNKITSFSYIYEYNNIENYALQNVQISGSSAVTKSSDITGFFFRRDAILSYEIIQQLYFLPH